MSLSKPALIPIPSSRISMPSGSGSGGGYWPKIEWPAEWKWTTVACGVAPVLILGAGAGYFYWKKKQLPAKKKSEEGQGESADDSGYSLDASKPSHIILKEAGNNYFKLNDYPQALENYNAAINEKPSGPELATLYQNRAAVFEKLQDWVQVIRECSAALELNPTYVKALHRRAKAYKETGFHEEALEDVTGVCILESFQHASSIQLADQLLQEIGLQEANKLIKARKPSPPSAHNVASFFRSFHNDPLSVIWNAGSVPEKTTHLNGDAGAGELPELKGYQLAISRLAQHEVLDAIDLCTEEINTPGSKFIPEAYFLRGTLRFLWGAGVLTLEDYNAVIAHEGASNELKSAAWVKKGVYYSYLPDDIDPSKESYGVCFEQAERLTPDSVDVYHQRGQVLLMKGQVDAASVEIQRGSELAPDFALAPTSKLYLQFRIACMTSDHSGMNESIREFNKCLRKFPNCPDIFGLYGQMLLEIDRLQEAQEQFDKVIQLEPNNTTVAVHKAMLQYRMTNDASVALKLLHDACKLDDKSEFVYETIGTLSLQTGDLDGAANAFTKALQLAKTHQEILMLSSMKKAAEIQAKVRGKLGLEIPKTA